MDKDGAVGEVGNLLLRPPSTLTSVPLRNFLIFLGTECKQWEAEKTDDARHVQQPESSGVRPTVPPYMEDAPGFS